MYCYIIYCCTTGVQNNNLLTDINIEIRKEIYVENKIIAEYIVTESVETHTRRHNII